MDLQTILSWFKRGCKPTEAQFAATFRSFRHKDDPVPMEDVTGLAYAIANKSEKGHTHTLAEITDYDGGDKEVLNAMVAEDSAELDAFAKTEGMYYILLADHTLHQYVHDEDTDTDTLIEVDPDGKVVYSAYDADDNLHIYLYNVPNMEFQDVTNEQVNKTIYTNDLDTLITRQLKNGIYSVVHINSGIDGNIYGDAYTLTVGDGSVFSRVLECRSGWAQAVLIDESYQWEWHRYAYTGHKHQIADVEGLPEALDDKADANHNHDGVYQPAGSYAAANHNHDGVYQPAGNYAASDHTHSQYLTQHQDISGKQDIITDLATIRANAAHAATRAYTLDFGTGAELIQDVNMLGSVTINRLVVLNVARLYVTYGTVSHQLIDLTQPVSLNVADGQIITWEIERTIDDGLACVGVRCSINS